MLDKLSKGHKNNLIIIGILVLFVVGVAALIIGGLGSSADSTPPIVAPSQITAPSAMNQTDNRDDPRLMKLLNDQADQEAQEKDTYAPMVIDDLKPEVKENNTVMIPEFEAPAAYQAPKSQVQVVQTEANPMLGEMAALMTSWVPGTIPGGIIFEASEVAGDVIDEVAAVSGGSNMNAEAINEAIDRGTYVKPDIRAGTILYAQIVTDVNSDEPGPILIDGLSKEIRGMRLIANGYTVNEESLTINVDTLVAPFGTIGIDTFMINPSNARTVVQSDVDHHYFQRWGSFFLTSVLTEAGALISEVGTQASTVTGTVPVTTTNTVLSATEKGWVIAGRTADRLSAVAAKYMERPNTVYLHRNETVGLLFMADVVLPKDPEE